MKVEQHFMIKVLIPEDIPSSNKGEAALFAGIVKSLETLGTHELTVLSIHPEDDRRAYGDRATVIDARGIAPAHLLDSAGTFGRKLKNYLVFISRHILFACLYALMGRSCLTLLRRDIWRCYLDADLILMSHDSFYAPLYHGPLILLFKWLGKPVIVYGGTILPPDSSKGTRERRARNILNKLFLKRVDLIALREGLSYAYVKSLGLTTVERYPDLAFLADAVPDDEVDLLLEKEAIPKNRRLIGFAFSQKEMDHAYPHLPLEQRREKALDAIASLMDYITRDLDALAVFIPHAIGPTPRVDDRIAADWVRERCRNRNSVRIIRNDYSPAQLRGLAKRLNLTVGTRLHFTIDALCMMVPSLLITHRDEYRCHGIIGEMLGQARFVYNIEEIGAESLITMTRDLWENRDCVRQDLRERIPRIKQETMKTGIRAKEVFDNFYKAD